MVEDNAPWRDEDTLRQKYCDEELSTRDLAELWDCSRKTITNWLKRFDIPRRNSHMESKPWQDKNTLEKLYIEKDMNCREVGDELGCSARTSQKWLREYDLYRRYRNPDWLDKKFNEEELYIGEIADMANASRRTVAEWLDKLNVRDERDRPAPHHGEHTNKDLLQKLYKEEKLSCGAIADRLNCSTAAVRHWLIKHDIDRRDPWYSHIPSFYTTEKGYEVISHGYDGESHMVGVHRLVAYANEEMSSDELFDTDMHIHHENKIPWDNRQNNLTALSASEHMRLHAKES